MISAIVFDFDGVLADSENLHLRSYQAVLGPRGGTMSRDEYFSRYLGYDDHDVFRTFGEEHGWRLTEAEIVQLIAEKARVFDEMEGGADLLYPGATECVARLGAHFPLGIASGALRHEIEAVLAPAGLLAAFRFIVASGDTPAGKPAPDPYRRAATLHGIAPEACVAIEDSSWGIASARAAGLKCVGITHTYSRDALTAADRVIDSLAEFTPALIRALG